MIARNGDWAEVQVGSYIQAPDGSTWRVDGDRDGWLLLTSAAGQRTAAPRPTGPVVIMEPSEAEAVATLEQRLGAEVMAVVDHQTRAIKATPWADMSPANRRVHLQMLHGIYADDVGTKKTGELDEAHAWGHNGGGNLIPHTHER